MSPSRAASPALTSNVHSCLPFTSAGTLCIHELLDRRCRRPMRTSSSLRAGNAASTRGMSVGDGRRAQLDPAGRGAQDLRDPLLQRPEVDAVRVVEQLAQRQSIVDGAEPVTVRSAAQLQVECAFLPGLTGQQATQLLDIAAGPLCGLGQRGAQLLLGQRVEIGLRTEPDRIAVSRSRMSDSSSMSVLRRDHRRGELGDVAHREAEERDVVVRAPARRRRRQDHVGVPGGLVEVRVDATP